MKNNKYTLGVVSVSFRQSAPKEILEAARKAGLACIEWGSDVHAPCGETERLLEIAELQKKYGIVCSSYGTYFRLGKSPIEELEQYIHAARLLGTNILRLWCGTKAGRDMNSAERQDLLSLCIEASKIAGDHGVILCMECHKKTFTEDPDDAVWLMRSVDSSNFRMYWQPFQWQSAYENIENAKKIAPYAEHIHVFNWKGDKKFSLCEAVGEWRRYLCEFPSRRTLLLEFMPDGTMEELNAEASALKSIIGEDV